MICFSISAKDSILFMGGHSDVPQTVSVGEFVDLETGPVPTACEIPRMNNLLNFMHAKSIFYNEKIYVTGASTGANSQNLYTFPNREGKWDTRTVFPEIMHQSTGLLLRHLKGQFTQKKK